jgi:hypothetical protein
MNLNAYNDWKTKVDEHYGDVEKFPDARTIRIMRGGLLEQLNEYLKWVMEATNEETKAAIREVFQDDAKIAATEIMKLDRWLEKRGLEP